MAVATEVRSVVEWPRVGTLAVGTDVDGPYMTYIFEIAGQPYSHRL